MTGQGLGLVVEVDEQRLVEAGLDEAVGVPVVAGVEILVGEAAGDVLGQDLGLEVCDRAGLRCRQVGRVAEGEDVRLAGVWRVCLSVGMNPSASPRPAERST